MSSRIALHVTGALLVVGLASSTAFAINESCARLAAQAAKKIVCELAVKSKGAGGKIRCELDGDMCFVDNESIYFEGGIGIPVGNETVWRGTALDFPYGGGSRFSNTVARTKYNSRKDSGAEFLLSSYTFLFGSINNATIPAVMKSRGYRPLQEGFVLESGATKGSARVFDDFSKYNGSFKAKFKGTTVSGERVKAQLKLVFKSAERQFGN